jgi:CHASE2 domain-containing sensor protein
LFCRFWGIVVKSGYILQIALASVLQTAFWLLALLSDPFGMATAADRASEAVFLRLYPIIYPATQQDSIRVVMIDDEALPMKPFGSKEWPLEYNEYAELISRVLAQKPRGVFVDLLFDTEIRRDFEPLQQMIRSIPRDGPPVVFATYADEKAKILLPPELGFKGGGAMKGVVELVSDAHHYQIGLGRADGAASAGVVLYNATMMKPSDRIPIGKNGQFLVAWGNTLPKDAATDPNCENIVDSPDSRWNAFVHSIWSGLSGAIPLQTRTDEHSSWQRMQPCPYHTEISARDVMQLDDSTLKSQLKDKYVLIGADVKGSGDIVNSPVHGQLPGVFLHAMALDNLLTFKGKPLEKNAWVDLLQAALIFLCTFAGGVLFSHRQASTSPGSALQSLGLRMGAWLSFACILAILIVVLLRLEIPIAPYNWGGVLSIGLAVFFAGAGRDLLALVTRPSGRS